MATGNFDGIDFEIQSKPLAGSASARVVERPIPGGGTVFDIMGVNPKTRRYRIFNFTSAAFAALEDKRGTVGTLTTTAFGTHTAILRNVDWDNQEAGGETEGSAEFTLLS